MAEAVAVEETGVVARLVEVVVEVVVDVGVVARVVVVGGVVVVARVVKDAIVVVVAVVLTHNPVFSGCEGASKSPPAPASYGLSLAQYPLPRGPYWQIR